MNSLIISTLYKFKTYILSLSVFIFSYFFLSKRIHKSILKPLIRKLSSNKSELERKIDSYNYLFKLNKKSSNKNNNDLLKEMIKFTHLVSEVVNNSNVINNVIKSSYNDLILDYNKIELINTNISYNKNIQLIYMSSQYQVIAGIITKVKKLPLETEINLSSILSNNTLFINIPKIYLLHKTKNKYSKDKNIKQLEKLWYLTKKDEEINIEKDKKWIDIGFQGAEPETDFRATGLFGLEQLLLFCEKSKYFKEVYSTATDSTKWYFFAAAGINITGKIVEVLLDSKFIKIKNNNNNSNTDLVDYKNDNEYNELLYLLFSKFTKDNKLFDYSDKLTGDFNNDFEKYNELLHYFTYDILSKVYEEVFYEFNNDWLLQDKFDFMKFNTRFISFSEKNIKRIINKVITDEIKKSSTFY